jgi:lysophospholipase L1-like esterase
MKIAFVGDSLTEGIPGVGYFGVLKRKLKGCELINYGKGGDSVVSLLKRIKKIKFAADIDIIVLDVGVNDVLVNVSKTYPLIKTLLRQPWSKDKREFEKCYQEILSYLSPKAGKLIAIPPLLLGEELKSRWNKQLGILSGLIKRLVLEYKNVIFLDVRKTFIGHLKNKPVSGYITKKVFTVVSDALLLRQPKSVDKKSAGRGLHYTLDGVHLNSAGAEILADAIIKEIEI